MHIPNTSQQVQYNMTEIQVLWNYSHSVFVLNEIYSIPSNRATIIRN